MPAEFSMKRPGIVVLFIGLVSMGSGLIACRSSTPQPSAAATTAPASLGHLDEYFLDDLPVEYRYVTGCFLRNSNSATPSTSPSANASIHVVRFAPGEERFLALMVALEGVQLRPKDIPKPRWGVVYGDSPSVWKFSSVPQEPARHYALLLQDQGERGVLRIAIGAHGFLLVEPPGRDAKKFRTQTRLFEWLAVMWPAGTGAGT
jgi:hypothetical protein